MISIEVLLKVQSVRVLFKLNVDILLDKRRGLVVSLHFELELFFCRRRVVVPESSVI